MREGVGRPGGEPDLLGRISAGAGQGGARVRGPDVPPQDDGRDGERTMAPAWKRDRFEGRGDGRRWSGARGGGWPAGASRVAVRLSPGCVPAQFGAVARVAASVTLHNRRRMVVRAPAPTWSSTSVGPLCCVPKIALCGVRPPLRGGRGRAARLVGRAGRSPGGAGRCGCSRRGRRSDTSVRGSKGDARIFRLGYPRGALRRDGVAGPGPLAFVGVVERADLAAVTGQLSFGDAASVSDVAHALGVHAGAGRGDGGVGGGRPVGAGSGDARSGALWSPSPGCWRPTSAWARSSRTAGCGGARAAGGLGAGGWSGARGGGRDAPASVVASDGEVLEADVVVVCAGPSSLGLLAGVGAGGSRGGGVALVAGVCPGRWQRRRHSPRSGTSGHVGLAVAVVAAVSAVVAACRCSSSGATT